MSYSQNSRTDTNLQTADNYFNNLYDQNVTMKFLHNKTTGRKTVVEGVANVGDVLTIVSPSSGNWQDPDVARWQSGGGGTMSDFTLQTTNPLKVDGVNSTVVNNADVVNLSLAPSPAVGTYPNPVSITVTNEGLVSNVVSGGAPVVPLSKNVNVSSALSSTGNNSFYANNNVDLDIDIADQVNPVSGTWGDANNVAVIDVNNKGIITSVVNTPIAFPADINKSVTVTPNLVLTGDNVFNGPNATNLNIDLSDTPVVPNVYGNSTSVSQVNIDQKGRVVGASNVPIGGITVATNAPITGGSTVFPNGNLTLSHAASGVIANPSYGSATSVPVFGVNSTGHVTSVTNTPISFPADINKSVTVSSNLIATGDNVFNGPNATNLNIDLGNTPVVSGIYGNSANIPRLDIDQKGRIQSASVVPISFPASVVTINTTTPIAGGGVGNTFTLSHANSTVLPGAYGNPGNALIPIITCDQKGHITAASQGAIPSQAVAGDGSVILGGGSVLGINPGITLSHANFGTAGTYGSNTTTNIIQTNASGHITSITPTAIAFPPDTSLDSIALRNWKAGTGSLVGASDNVVIGDTATSSTVRTNIIGSGASSTAGGDNNIIGYQSTSSSTNTNILGNGSTATANNTNIIGSGITNSLVNSTTIGSNLSNHIVNSTGYYRSTNQYSCQATNTANVVYNVFPATLTIAPANINWNFTNGVGVVSNSLLLNDPDALFHIEANVTINVTPPNAAATQHQFQCRLRYIDNVSPAVNISTQSQFYYSTSTLQFALAYSISGYIRTPNVIGAGQFAFVDIFRNTSSAPSVTCNNYRITMTRVA